MANKLKVLRSMSKIDKFVQAKIDNAYKEVEKIAGESTEIAKKTLLVGTTDEGFTQKHGIRLVDYIHLSQGANKGQFKIEAGNDGTPSEILYELYYAEYGAGVTAEDSPVFDPYVPHGKTMHNGYWYYPLLDFSDNYHGWGFTDRSIPLRYMLNAKEYAHDRLKLIKPKIAKSIKTSIKRGLKV